EPNTIATCGWRDAAVVATPRVARTGAARAASRRLRYETVVQRHRGGMHSSVRTCDTASRAELVRRPDSDRTVVSRANTRPLPARRRLFGGQGRSNVVRGWV